MGSPSTALQQGLYSVLARASFVTNISQGTGGVKGGVKGGALPIARGRRKEDDPTETSRVLVVANALLEAIFSAITEQSLT